MKKDKHKNKQISISFGDKTIHLLIHSLYIYSIAKLSFKIIPKIEVKVPQIGALQAYQSFVVVIILLPHLSRAPPLLLWLAFSLGRGIPKGQVISAFRLIRDFPSHSSHPFSLPPFRHITVSSSQTVSLRPPADSALPHSGVPAPLAFSEKATLT